MSEYFAGGHLRFVDGEWRDDDGNMIEISTVRHGRWLNIEENIVLSYNTYFPMTTTSETCSECNVRSAFIGKKSYVKDNRCPNCGAIMDLEG